MTDLRAAAQQALELLKELQGGCTDSDDGTVEALTVWCPEVIENLEAALEQPEQEQEQEQAWLTGCPSCGMDGGCAAGGAGGCVGGSAGRQGARAGGGCGGV